MKYILLLLLSLLSTTVFASDPSTSVYQVSKQDDSAGSLFLGARKGDGDVDTNWAFFKFGDTDSIFGSLAVARSSDSQSIKLNAINYNLWLGGEYKIPFQLYLSEQVSDEGTEKANNEVNSEKLLDLESGVAIKFPILWMYQKQATDGGVCAFLSGDKSSGHCSIGGDITLNFKELTNAEGVKDTAFGQTLRFGGSVLFPVHDITSNQEQGYLSLSAKVVYSHVNIDDSTQLFSPVLDIEGNPIKFDNSIFSSEVELKWAFTGKFAIIAKWLKPFDNKVYIDDVFKLSLESKF